MQQRLIEIQQKFFAIWSGEEGGSNAWRVPPGGCSDNQMRNQLIQVGGIFGLFVAICVFVLAPLFG